MATLNKCMFIGNVGKIETRYLPNGDAVTNLSLAVNENYKNKDGQKVERTEWVNVTIYRKLAEIAAEYVKVGMPLYIEGKMQTRKWQDEEGRDRYTTEIIADQMQMLGGKPEQQERSDVPAERSQPKQNAGAFDNFDDDIPFDQPYRPTWRAV